MESHEIKQLVYRLQSIGQQFWYQHWHESMALPDKLTLDDHESVVRYLLLRALLNQQGDTGRVRKLVSRLLANLGPQLLYEPMEVAKQFDEVLTIFRQVGGEKGAEIYRVGALGGIKPLSLFLYRFAAFTFFVCRLQYKLCQIVEEKLKQGIKDLWVFFRDDPILEGGWVGNDPKAARMLTNWLAWMFSEVWNKIKVNLTETLMIVDGHVGKVFCRTGVMEEVSYESGRPFIILAKEMRSNIEILVKSIPQVAPMFVDEGAFQVAMNWCFEAKPNCQECPLQDICLAGRGSSDHLRWSAYQKFGSVPR
ncbi:MAG: hypothetical protein N3B10_08065 [Armatimonadetes bacterium]|nr:hypothetical protein [Armatimonadota bacterium]